MKEVDTREEGGWSRESEEGVCCIGGKQKEEKKERERQDCVRGDKKKMMKDERGW